MKFALSRITTGLVIRAKEVEVLSMRGKTVVSQARVPVEGSDEQHLVDAIQRAVDTASLKTKKVAVSIPSRSVAARGLLGRTPGFAFGVEAIGDAIPASVQARPDGVQQTARGAQVPPLAGRTGGDPREGAWGRASPALRWRSLRQTSTRRNRERSR